MRTTMKVASATALFAAVHSLLASTKVKDAVAAHVPHGRLLYRAAYNAQAVLAFGALVGFVLRQPSRTVWRVRGPAALLMRLGQLGGIAFAVDAARATGVATLSGLDNLAAVIAGTDPHPVPAAQGPERDVDGNLRIRGPFRRVRHPLNLAPLAPFWLAPHMTTRRLAFNIIGTLYLVAGSWHEEQRLLRQYGDEYARYRQSGTPFYLPLKTVLR